MSFLNRFAVIGSVLLIAGALVLAGCQSSDDKLTITVGSSTFSEPWIMGEMAKLLIEHNIDNVEVNHISGLQGAQVLHGAIMSEEIDLYMSWTGTEFTGRLDMVVTEEWRDRQKVYDYVKEQFEDRYELTILPPLGFENTYAAAVRSDFAEEHGLTSISDLEAMAEDLTVGVDQWFLEQEGDGYNDLIEYYGFEFGRAVEMDYGIMYRSVQTEDVDVIIAYSTDGRIVAMDLTILEDDLSFFPPYDGIFVIREALIEEHPEVVEALEPLFGMFDERLMGSLNAKVDVDEEEFRDVAREFLQEEGLID